MNPSLMRKATRYVLAFVAFEREGTEIPSPGRTVYVQGRAPGP
jgi:hypothetical protein